MNKRTAKKKCREYFPKSSCFQPAGFTCEDGLVCISPYGEEGWYPANELSAIFISNKKDAERLILCLKTAFQM